MSSYDKYYEARNIIVDILKTDFVGPVFEDEILTEFPVQYYIMGKLYPQGNSGEILDYARNPLLENGIESYDVSISLSNQRNPSSCGITFLLKAGVDVIVLSGKYAFYEPVAFEKAQDYGVDILKWKNSENPPETLWKRQGYSFEIEAELPITKVSSPISLKAGIQLQIFTHAILESGERVVTVVMLNTNVSENETAEEKARLCAFQTGLRVSGLSGKAIFADTNLRSNISVDEELLELEMLYSDVHCYAQGHGCSVAWDMSNTEPTWVETDWMASYNLKQMMASKIENQSVLSMNYLATADSADVSSALKNFAESYRCWIDEIHDKAKMLPEHFKAEAECNIEKCYAAYHRIMNAIELLSDSKAFQAFRLANEAMLMQRRQTLIKGKREYDAEKVLWYPFQLAFVLHEISSFINPESKERKIVDLLWFPTGGGKTEAYLGIAAFAIFIRRLRNQEDDGVTVIMRYTLRLLTIQQFERASMLICACELIRKKYKLGGTAISIGLWVGGDLTPNSLSNAQRSIMKQQRGAVITEEESNPCQIQICPWCGNHITAHEYSINQREKRMVINCSNQDCDFHNAENGLPLHIIDEAVYQHLPTFLVATVDKFAQIPLSEKPAAIFGISNGKNPPDLIIQDELHLISGPLGTMTGIYEAAVTKLCERNGIGAKIIASTATIRNAHNQILALYGKEFVQFPPQGISVKDSYFAVESTEEEKPTRAYLGIMGIGVTATTALIRVNAALLFATRYLELLGYEDSIIDNFWTITGYFNSLRELGGASTQVLDDVQSRFSYLAKTKFGYLKPQVNYDAQYDNIVELTSRMNNSEITSVIQDKLKRSYRCGIHSDVYDFVLASNMISVGVDVGRLGVMTVAGQPKTNAEYIQATSRVGRDNPGMVVTIYNSTRSRDRSHYEQFLRYHSALYRYVEATSLTPFADRARDRGLHALYVALCRYLVPGLLGNEDAVNYQSNDSGVISVRNMILDYVELVDPDELDAVIDELSDIEEQWELETTGSLVYRSFKSEKKLLKSDIENDRFRTMNSMRNVDAQSGIYLMGR